MPIKLNNERLPGKNTMVLGDKPLIRYELDTLVNIQRIDEIYVYCSSPEIVKYLPQKVRYLKRPDFLDLPTSNFTQIFKEFSNEKRADIYIYAHATAPFITSDTIEACLNAVISREYDSAFCAVKIQDFLWKQGQPLNFAPDNIPRSQDIEPIYRETSGIYVFTAEVFNKFHRRIGHNPYIKEVSYKEAVDINTAEDFRLGEALINVDM